MLIDFFSSELTSTLINLGDEQVQSIYHFLSFNGDYYVI